MILLREIVSEILKIKINKKTFAPTDLGILRTVLDLLYFIKINCLGSV